MTNYEQNLEIQDKFIYEKYRKDSHIKHLILLQQINKLSEKVK